MDNNVINQIEDELEVYSKMQLDERFNTIEIKMSKVRIFDTVEEFLSKLDIEVGSIIELLGYYKKEDGAGHRRVIAQENDGTGIPYGTNFANIVCENELYSTWFGCKQDGQTDDTENFQQFLNKFGVANLIVPFGVIRITHMIVIKGIFRSEPDQRNNRAYRLLEFRGSALRYDGEEGKCSVMIAYHAQSIIDGLALTEIDRTAQLAHLSSKDSYVNICSTWYTEFKNFHIDRLYFNENNTDIPRVHPDLGVYYQFANIFSTGYIRKNIKINSTPQDIPHLTWLINSLTFEQVRIGSEGSNYAEDYNITLCGGAGLNNLSFYDCDISYARKAIFDIRDTFPIGTINMTGTYFDSAVPLVENYDYKKIFFNLVNNYEASNDSNQIYGLKTENLTSNTRMGSRGVEANYLPMGIMNLAKNGNLEYDKVDNLWMSKDGVETAMLNNKNYTLYGNALQITFQTKGKGIHFKVSEGVPLKGTYTLGIRAKKVSGVGILQLNYNNKYYKNYDLKYIKEQEEIVISTFGNGTVILAQGEAVTGQLYAIDPTDQLVIEVLEVIFVQGIYVGLNLPIHPASRLVKDTSSSGSSNITFEDLATGEVVEG